MTTPPPSWRTMANNTGATCIRCGKGRYKVFDLNDDIFGDLRCDNCRHHVKSNQYPRKCLSPQAQAVLNAYKDARDGQYVNDEWIQDEAGQVAAALRAAADHIDHDWSAFNCVDALCEIAAELEGQ